MRRSARAEKRGGGKAGDCGVKLVVDQAFHGKHYVFRSLDVQGDR